MYFVVIYQLVLERTAQYAGTKQEQRLKNARAGEVVKVTTPKVLLWHNIAWITIGKKERHNLLASHVALKSISLHILL